MARTYLIAGNCVRGKKRSEENGLSVYAFDEETASLTLLGAQYDPLIMVGYQCCDPDRGIIYVCDEYVSQIGMTGGGGNILSYSIDPAAGKLTRMSSERSFASNPSYCAFDTEKRFLILTHHCMEDFVTRLACRSDGSFDTETLYDDCLLISYRLAGDGDIREIADIIKIEGFDEEDIHRFPHLHCVMRDRSGRFFFVTDKGLDRVYTYALSPEGKLRQLSEVQTPRGSEPRYMALHPARDLVYVDFEHDLHLRSYRIDAATGRIEPADECPLREGISAYRGHPMVGDLLIDPAGRHLYTALRTDALISVVRLSEDGGMELAGVVDCAGRSPRGMCLSPDGRFLLAADPVSGSIFGFIAEEDGGLRSMGTLAEGGHPANLQIVRLGS